MRIIDWSQTLVEMLNIHLITKPHIMKISIALVLSCASAIGADPGIQVSTSTSPVGIQVTTATNRTGVHHEGICKSNVFTRDGQTVLVCDTFTENGAWVARVQSFYHDGALIANSVATPAHQDFVPVDGSQCSVSFRFHPSNEVEFVYFSGKDGNILDGFNCTNGIYFPAESRLILELNDEIKMDREANKLRQFLIAQ